MLKKIISFIVRLFLYLVIIISFFAIAFSISFYASYQWFDSSPDNININGAKNLLENYPINEDNSNDNEVLLDKNDTSKEKTTP